mmetsp:Transcript_36312/g.88955  ORF Transcript_36312/g.88955 Transcript_36312/m.88955 type:complete len:298 (-) Transcript_36312:2-895(-)
MMRSSLHWEHLLRSSREVHQRIASFCAEAGLIDLEQLDVFVDCLSALPKNTILVSTVQGTAVAAGLYPSICMANHSCSPNGVVSFSGRQARLRATCCIKEGEEVCIAYVDPILPVWRRLRVLSSDYGFECRCPSCVDPSAELDKVVSSTGDVVLTSHELCGTPSDPGFRDVVGDRQVRSKEYSLAELQQCLLDLQPLHLQVLALSVQAFEAGGPDVLEHSTRILHIYRRFYSRCVAAPLARQLLAHAKALHATDRPTDCAAFAAEAAAMCSVVHGEDHPEALEARTLLAQIRYTSSA